MVLKVMNSSLKEEVKMKSDYDPFKDSSKWDYTGIDRSYEVDYDDTIVVSTALSSLCIEKEPYNLSGGSLIYSQTLTFQDTLTVNLSIDNELDISGIEADVDGSDNGVDDLETEADNMSDVEFDVLPTSFTHPTKESNKSCRDVKATLNAYYVDDSSLLPVFKDSTGSYNSFTYQHLRRSIDATAKEEESHESVELPERMTDDHDKFSAESLLFAENYTRNAPFPPRLILALPTIRFPTKYGIVDNLPDWDLSAKPVYHLQWYMTQEFEKVEVTLVPDSPKIVYHPKLRQFHYFGEPDEWFQSIAYVNVTSKGITDSAIFLAYTSAKQQSTSVATTANHGQSSGTSQNGSEIGSNLPGDYRGVGIDLGTIKSCCNI
jgi:hypothetical protein